MTTSPLLQDHFYCFKCKGIYYIAKILETEEEDCRADSISTGEDLLEINKNMMYFYDELIDTVEVDQSLMTRARMIVAKSYWQVRRLRTTESPRVDHLEVGRCYYFENPERYEIYIEQILSQENGKFKTAGIQMEPRKNSVRIALYDEGTASNDYISYYDSFVRLEETAYGKAVRFINMARASVESLIKGCYIDGKG